MYPFPLNVKQNTCDTEDWSNDDKISALHHRNVLRKKMLYQIVLILHFFIFIVMYFYQINDEP